MAGRGLSDVPREEISNPKILIGRRFWSALERRVGGPRVLVLDAVEVVAPERLLVASEAQPPLVCGAVLSGDAAVEEALVASVCRRRRRAVLAGEVSRPRVDVRLEGPVGVGEDEEDEHGHERPAGDCGTLHGQHFAENTFAIYFVSQSKASARPQCTRPAGIG